MDDTRTPVGPGRSLFSPSRLEPKTALTACLVLLVVALGVYVLWHTPVAIAITFLSTLLAVALDRPVRWLEGHRCPRGAAIALVTLLLFALVAAIDFILVPLLVDQTVGLIRWVRHLPQVERARPMWSGRVAANAGRAIVLVGSAVHWLTALAMTLVVAIFMLTFGRAAISRVLAEAAPRRRPRYQRMLRDAYLATSGYLSGMSVLMVCNAATMALFLAVLRVPYFLPLGLLSGLAVIVPNVGAAVAGVTLVGAAFLAGGLWKAIATGAFFAVYKLLEGNVLQPALYRRTIRLNPLATLLMVIFMTELAGILGAIAAVPLLAVLQVIGRELLALRREQRGGA